jgi:DNA-binding transcriptional MocR family regulator
MTTMARDELHKILRGTGISQGEELEARGWIRVVGREVQVVPIQERFAYFTERGPNRKIIKTDLDQTHFLIGAAFTGSGVKIETELNNPNFWIKKSVDELLKWYARMDETREIRQYAQTALQLGEHWRTHRDRLGKERKQLSLFEILEQDE